MKGALERIWRRVVGPREGVIPKQAIQAYIGSSPVVIEAGAHVGMDTLEMSRLWPQGSIYAFEPVPALHARLLARTCRCANVHCFALALGGSSGTRDMYLSSGASDGSSSLLAPSGHLADHPDTYFRETIPVSTITIDDWARQHAVESVDLLWLDMQGVELSALRSSESILAGVKAIHAEVSVREQYAGGPLYAEVREWLAARGFMVAIEAIPAHWDGGNVLFVRE